MRTAIAFLVLCVLGTGTVLANPIVGEQLYIDFDPPNLQYETYPAPFSTVDAYVVVDLTQGVPGFTEVSFALATTPGMASGHVFTNLVPGAVVVGDWFSGVTISADCITDLITPVARLSFVYEGTPGVVSIEDHPTSTRLLYDCEVPPYVYVFCHRYHGGVGQPAVLGDCGGNPVENVSWGAIKGLYE
jgi:hypothetical protein